MQIGVMRVLVAPAVDSEQRTAKCPAVGVSTRSFGGITEMAVGEFLLGSPRLGVPIYLSSVFAGHLSCIYTLKITWGSRVFLL